MSVMAGALLKAGLVTQQDVEAVDRREEEEALAEAAAAAEEAKAQILAQWVLALLTLDDGLAKEILRVNEEAKTERISLKFIEQWGRDIKAGTMTPDFGWVWLRRQAWYKAPQQPKSKED